MPLPRWGWQNYEPQTPLPRAVGQRNTPPIFRSGNTAQVQKRATVPRQNEQVWNRCSNTPCAC